MFRTDWVCQIKSCFVLKKHCLLLWLLRYYLYSLMFQTWKTYVYQQREMRSKYLRAENHGEKRTYMLKKMPPFTCFCFPPPPLLRLYWESPGGLMVRI